MASFDSKKYRNEVLKPNSRGEGLEQLREVLAELRREPQSAAYARLDLNALYEVPNPVTAQALGEWKKAISPALNKAQALPAAPLLKLLLEVLEQQGKSLTDPAFWGGLQNERQKLVRANLEDGLRLLRAEYPLGVVSNEELISRLQTVGIAGVTEKSIFSIAEQQGLKVFAALELPTGGIPEKLKHIWKDVNQHPDFRTIMDLLLLHRIDDLTNIEFLDRLSAGGSPVTIADIEQARLRSEQSQDTDALQDAQKFLGALKDNVASDGDLLRVVISTVAEGVSVHLGRGKPKLEVRDELVRCGFSSDDASRLVSTLSTGPAAGPRVGLDTVREKLGLGQLDDAHRTMRALAPGDGEEQEFSDLTAHVEKLVAKKKTLLDDYRRAMEARNYTAALDAINNAMSIDQADSNLETLKESLPPESPATFNARSEGANVVLNWPQVHDNTLMYTVVRAEGRSPKTVSDGTALATKLQKTSFTDANTPAAVKFGYSIFATRDGRVYSDPRSSEIMVLPAPTDLVVTADLSSALLGWTRPTSSAGIIVSQQGPDGSKSEIELATGSTYRAEKLVTGSSYRFSISAFYLLSTGRQLSNSVSITVIPRGEATPVRNLSITSESSNGSETLRATWANIDGFEVELWQFPRLTELPQKHLTAQQVKSAGGQRVSALSGSGRNHGETVQLFSVPTELVRLLPLTVTDDGYRIGEGQIVGSTPQPTQIVVENFGSDLRLSWDWPPGDFVVEVAWEAMGKQRTKRVTRARYRAEGGVKIVNGAEVRNLTIATIVAIDDDSWTSAPVAVNFACNPTQTVHYEQKIKRNLMGKVRCEILARSDTQGSKIAAKLILAEGSIMPMSADDGELIDSLELDFTSADISEHEVIIGKRKSPFWLMLFVDDDDVVLIDPPTSQLKG